MNLQRLIYLCHLKNELNRKRRRFYYYMNSCGRGPKVKHITPKQASYGYNLAQQQMKDMTHEMRRMRVECGARFVWNDGGLIEAIEFDGRRLSQKHFKRFHDSEVFELEFFKS